MRIVNGDELVSHSATESCYPSEHSALLSCDYSYVNPCTRVVGQERAFRCLPPRQWLDVTILTAPVNDGPDIDCDVDNNNRGSKQELNLAG